MYQDQRLGAGEALHEPKVAGIYYEELESVWINTSEMTVVIEKSKREICLQKLCASGKVRDADGCGGRCGLCGKFRLAS